MRKLLPFSLLGPLVAVGIASAFASDAPAQERKRKAKAPHDFKPENIDPLDKPRSKRARRRAAAKARAATEPRHD